MKKKCPQCNIHLEQALIANVEVDYCSRCYGLWFEEQELREAKDANDRNLRWLDIDLWKHEEDFRVAKGSKVCPVEHMPLYEVRYGDSNVRVDVCNICHGVWLDRGEFVEIIEYVKEKGYQEILDKYTQTLLGELWEIFSGPEMLQDEIEDFIAVVKLMQYKFAAQHPVLSRLMLALPY